MKRAGPFLIVIGGVALGVNFLGADDKPEGAAAPNNAQSLARPRLVDEFNSEVKDKVKGDGVPVRGESLRVRMPVEPKGLNRIIENGADARLMMHLMSSTLIDRDNASFEWLPHIAQSFEARDLILLKPEKEGGEPIKLEGRILTEESDGSATIALGAGTVTLGKQDIASLDIAKGVAVLKDMVYVKATGRVFSGKVSEQEGSVAIAVDMAWQAKETKTFKAEEVEVERGGAVTGSIEEGIPGRAESFTVRVTTTSKDIRKVTKESILDDEEKVGDKVKKFPALRRQVIHYFHMRRGVRWHDGRDVSPDDVLFTFNTIQNADVDCEHLRSYYSDLTSWAKSGPRSVRFEYGKQYFRALTFCGNITLMPAHRFQPEKFKGDAPGFGKHFNSHPNNNLPIYCGPYKFLKWEKGNQIELVRNDDWYAQLAGLPYIDPQRPYLDKIVFVVISDKTAANKELIKGNIDADFDIEPLSYQDPDNQTPEFNKNIVRAKFLQALYSYVGWNQNRFGVDEKKQFFRDRNVRLAMTMLIDRDTILRDIHYGLGEVVSGPFYKYGPFNNPEVEAVPYNPERAKVLLDRAGWVDHDGDGIRDKDGVPFEFDYLIHNGRAYHQQVADKVKEYVEQAGVRMTIRIIDWRVFQDTVRDRKFDSVRFAWGEPSCIETDPYQIWHGSQAQNRGSNYVSFDDPKANELIERIRRTLDFDKRQKMLHRLHKLIADEQPYTFFYNFYSLYFFNKRYRNVKLYIIGEEPYDLTEWYVPKELQRK